MNNFTWASRKIARDALERGVLKQVRQTLPHVEQYISAHRYPTLPKIVLYSAAASSEHFLKQYRVFPFYSFISPSPTAETDQAIARRFAEQVTHTDQEAPKGYGYIFTGFPFNPAQALLLDQYLNGVNLAIHCRQPDEPSDFVSSIQPLLNYYDQRGSLLELNHSTEPTFDQITNAQEEIRIKIKRSF